MAGMSVSTGKAIDGLDHIRQSIADIITTPIGSRVMRRDYGSLVPELLDRPMSDALLMQVYAATVMAVARWEPRIKITATHRTDNPQQSGTFVIQLQGQTVDGQPVNVGVPFP